MLVVNISYDAETRLMEVTSISTNGNAVGTTGDSDETRIQFSWHDPEVILDDYDKRVDFGVELIDSEGHAYKPYIPLDSNDGVVVSGAIMSAVKCGKLPIQLAFRKSTGELQEFSSLNILTLAVNRALDAMHDAQYERDPKFGDVLCEVVYNPTTATFTFTRVDGTEVDIALTDLAEDHFEVEYRFQLTSLSQAGTGDTATVTSSGIWYKLYGAYNVLENWKQIPGGVTLNGTAIANPQFYAPTTHGTVNSMLFSNGQGNAPVWKRTTLKEIVSSNTELTINLFDSGQPRMDLDSNMGLICSFKEYEGESLGDDKDDIIIPYTVNYDSSGMPESISLSNLTGSSLEVTIVAVPYARRW